MSYLSQISDKISTQSQLDVLKAGVVAHQTKFTELQMLNLIDFYRTAQNNLNWINAYIPNLYEFLDDYYKNSGEMTQFSLILIGICGIAALNFFSMIKNVYFWIVAIFNDYKVYINKMI